MSGLELHVDQLDIFSGSVPKENRLDEKEKLYRTNNGFFKGKKASNYL